ncbi:sporulation protein (spo0KD) related protein [Thermoplasma acidophilum]|uniref:Sporulation protein (Spo0KD) related protein n=1 Tax=Thermoplasma acidophilum (strain ATCC 25905 / DSM 1728 / JCM 9062 / NBRC 15155 / AMRC-C165) TaxID=273075 RepID=Q9HLF8_THEAC|nr:sporulation protein (spo0KD) related protein [Thermoplasma acidophilum]
MRNVSVEFKTYSGIVHALSDVSFDLKQGRFLGIVGESGSGKSTLALSIMSLLPENAMMRGSIYLKGTEYISDVIINNAKKKKARKILEDNLRNIRWKNISMVFQGAMNSFNPVYTIRRQMFEVFKIHTTLDNDEIEKKVEEALRMAGLNISVLDMYPHELSGGMKQRAVIAMALSLDPDIVIADEPTTGLDVITQAEIISQLKKLKENGKIKSLILISHDLGVVSQLADEVMVLYAGKVFEYGEKSRIFQNTANPYTYKLIGSYPSIRNAKRYVEGIPGSLPDPMKIGKGCKFADRCYMARDVCREEEPELIKVEDNHYSACFYWDSIKKSDKSDVKTEPYHVIQQSSMVEVKDLVKYFEIKESISKALFEREKRFVRAVDDITFAIRKGEILGIVGESGSGKTTLGKTLLGLYSPTAGKITYSFSNGDVEITPTTSESELMRSSIRKETQMIFQDPYDSLNPKLTVYDIVAEPIIARRYHKGNKEKDDIYKNPLEILNLVKIALAKASLKPVENYLFRYPHELSGGERQRVATARALVLNSEFIIADEPTSMLDVSIRASFMNMMKEIRSKEGITMVYISHDIASTYYMSDKILVMYLGKAVEMGSADAIINEPLHPYTKALIKAIPTPFSDWDPSKIDIIGEIGNAINVPKGCRFYNRCIYRQDICKDNPPTVKGAEDHWYLCHFSQDELMAIKNGQKSPNS